MALNKFKNGELLTETQLNKVVDEVNGKASNVIVTASSNGLMSKEDKTKLNGIATNANNYTHPNDDNTRHVTDTEKATWNGKASTDAVSTTANGLMSTEDKVKLNGIATGANNYTHPINSGNKHIPSGGSAGKVLVWSEDGNVTWGDDTNTIYGVVSKISTGLVPQLPDEITTTKYFRQDGTWVTPPNTTYSAATESTLGLVKKAVTQDDSVASDVDGLVVDFNALLAKLKTAGLMS